MNRWSIVSAVVGGVFTLSIAWAGHEVVHEEPLPTPDYRVELSRAAGTMAVEIQVATVAAQGATWAAHVDAIRTEAADETTEWRRARE